MNEERTFVRLVDSSGVVFGGQCLPMDYVEYWADWTAETGQLKSDWPDVKERLEAQLVEELLAISDGQWLAVLDVIYTCQRHGLPLPEYAVTKLEEFFSAAVNKKPLGSRGRGNSPLAQAQNSVNRSRRHQLVTEIRRAQEYFSGKNLGGLGGGQLDQWDELDLVSKLHIPADLYELFLAGEIKSFGTTVEDAISLAAIGLRQTQASLSEDWLRNEYYRYSKEDYQPSIRALEVVGVSAEPLPAIFQDSAKTTDPESGVWDADGFDMNKWRPEPEPWSVVKASILPD
ncbi:hypothetical protein [Antarctobacter jejuensis]|uniref:hypothetical protein n=1 Tax=Antarctobacter jejuensis TaxID=1439938 RepID=UPI003FD2D876